MATLAPGHRLRVTLTTGSTPAVIPTPGQLLNLLGGVYQVQRHGAAPSTISIPLAPAAAFDDPCELCH